MAASTTTKPKTNKTSTNSHRSSSSKSGKATHGKSKSTKSAKTRSHGQQGIDQERTAQIQQALIREHYLSGEPTGSWDQSTRDALARFQESNGWQTKSLPDSRALIKLGLGPNTKGLLNPDTAVVTSANQLSAGHEMAAGSPQQ